MNAIRDLINLHPDNVINHNTYGEILMYFQNYEDAIDQFREALTLAEDGWYVYQTRD